MPRRTRILRLELLEDRVTPIAGDLLRTLGNPAAVSGDQFGGAVAVAGNLVVIGAPYDDPGGVTDAGSAYVFNLDTGALVATLNNPAPAAGDKFGWSVTLAYRDSVIHVAAPYDDPSGLVDSGAIYTFYSNGTWVDTINNPSPAAGDLFGFSLGAERAGSHLAVGAPGDDFGATDAGRAYVMGHNGGGFVFGVASNPAPAANDQFGYAVAVDPFGQLTIGAPYDDRNGFTDTGAVFAYDYNAGAIIYTIENPAQANGDLFGASVGVGGNASLGIIGAPNDDPGGVADAGSAYVFDANYSGGETTGAHLRTIPNPFPAVGDNFGAAVSINNFVAVVGAPLDDPGGVADAGAVYEFRAITGTLMATLANPTPELGDRFGAAIAQFDAYWEDIPPGSQNRVYTTPRAVVGAIGDDTGATDAGNLYSFDLNNPPAVRNDSALVFQNSGPTVVTALGNDSRQPDSFEFLTVSAVTQGTSGGTVAIGTHIYSTTGGIPPETVYGAITTVTYTPPANFVGTDTFTYTASDSYGGFATATVTVTVVNAPAPALGAVPGSAFGPFIYQYGKSVAVSGNRMAVGSATQPVRVYDTDTGAVVATLNQPGGSSNEFGFAVAMSGNRVVVGDWGANKAYLYDATTGALLHTFLPQATPTGPLFGFSVALSGNTVVIGANENNESFGTGPSRPGRVYVFDAVSGALQRTIVNPTPGYAEEFGSAVALDGNLLAVGSPLDAVAANLALGQVYLYDVTTGALLRTLNTPTLGSHNFFGISVGVSGNRVVVGAREAAYVFDAATGNLTAHVGSPTYTNTEGFGHNVSISGNRIVVGAYAHDPSGVGDAGAAYLFDATTGRYLRPLNNPQPGTADFFGGDSFGAAVAISGDRVVVAANNHDLFGQNAGAAFVFDVSFPPTAGNDSLTVAEDSVDTIVPVLANDTTEPDTGETLTVIAVGTPTFGTATLVSGVVRYTPPANFNGTATFTYTISDGTTTATATVTVTITPVSDPPVAATNETTALTYIENAAPVAVLPNFTVDDPDGGNLASATVTLIGFVAGQDVLAFTPAGGISGSLVGNVLTLTGAATIAAYQQTIRSITYANSSENPSAAARSLAVIVSDGSASSPEVSRPIIVTPVNDAPTLATNAGLTLAEGGAATIGAAQLAAADVDNTATQLVFTLTAIPANGTLRLGTTALGVGGTFTQADIANGLLNYTHNGSETTTDSFTVTVSDGALATGPAVFSITVTPVNDPPVAGDDAASTAEDNPLTLTAATLLVNDTDPDNTPAQLVIAIASAPAHGTAVPDGAGGVTYTPAANYFGTDTFTYTLSDGSATSAPATVTITITPVNDAPTLATNAGLTLGEGGTAAIGAAQLAATDVDNTATQLVFTLTAVPTNGSLRRGTTTLGVGATFTQADIAAGRLTYTHNGSETTADSFAVTVSDGALSVGPATFAITVTPVNDAPVAGNDTATVTEDGSLPLSATTLLVNDIDPDNTPAQLVIAIASAPAHGTAVPDGAGGVTYTPAANYFGTDTFTYTLSDGSATSAPATVTITITPVNDAPTAAADAATTPEDTAATIAVLANDSAGPLEPDQVLAITAVTQGTLGTVAIVGTTLVYTPAANVSGTDTFTYTITDGAGGTATATVTVTINAVNELPTATADTLTVTEDAGPTVVPVLANDSFAPDIGETLTVIALTQPANGTVTLTNGVVRFTPSPNFAGTDAFTYTISDGNGGTATATVSVIITPVNDAPTATADTLRLPEDSTPTAVNVLANDSADPDSGETLTVVAVTQPTRGTVTLSNGAVQYAPRVNFVGVDTFTYTVSDGNGGTATATVAVTVTSVGRAIAVGGRTDGSAAIFAPNVATGLFSNPNTVPGPFGVIPTSVRTAVGDVDGDGAPDTVLVTGPGVPVRVAVVSGADGRTLVAPFAPFTGSEDFTGGGFVATADLDGDGRADFVVTPDRGGGPRVTVFSLTGGTAVVRANFFGIDDTDFRGGVRSALGDVNRDGTPDMAVAAGFLGGPRVALFDGTTVFATPTRMVGDFFAFPGADAARLRNGAYVAVGDVDGDGFAEMIFGGGPGGAPRVYVLSGARVAALDIAGAQANPVANFFVAGNDQNRGGVRVATTDADGDGRADLVTGSGEGSPAGVRVYLGSGFPAPREPGTIQDLSVFGGAELPGGVFVG